MQGGKQRAVIITRKKSSWINLNWCGSSQVSSFNFYMIIMSRSCKLTYSQIIISLWLFRSCCLFKYFFRYFLSFSLLQHSVGWLFHRICLFFVLHFKLQLITAAFNRIIYRNESGKCTLSLTCFRCCGAMLKQNTNKRLKKKFQPSNLFTIQPIFLC